MVTVDASRVETRNVAPTVRSLPSLPVDILCIPGVTLWGPIMEAQVVYDYDDFTEKYHSYILDYETAVQVRQFFINGGRKAYVSRVVHMAGASPATAAKSYYTSQTGATAASHGSHTGSVAAPFNLANGDTLICDLDAVAPGVGQTWTCAATAGSRVSGNAEPYALVNLQTLFVSVNGELAQTVTFLTGEFVNIAAATAEECAAVINAKLSGAMATVTGAGTTVTITSDRLGTTSSIEITGGTAAAAFNFPAGAGAGGGNVPNAASVTITTLKPLLEAVWIASGGCTVSDSGGFMKVESDTTGATSKVQILAASTADTKVGFDNAVHSGSDGLAQDTLKVWGKYYGGTVGNSLTYDIAAASDGNAEHFNLVVYLDGIQRETHANLTMDTTVSDYVESRVNLLAGKSTLIEAEDKGATGTTLQRRPANATGVAMANGNDGLTALAEADFLGTETYGDGLHAFDTIDEGDILIIPDKITSTMYNSAISWCEGMKRNTVVLVADASAAADKTAVKALANALTPSEQCTGVMWPHVKIPNPDRTIYGQDDEITIAPSGTLAGLLARNTIAYERSGVFTQCGNETYGELLNVTGVESTVPKKLSVRREVGMARVNPILQGKASTGRTVVWLNDVMMIDPDGNWTSIGEARGVSHIRKTVMAYLESIRTTANSEENRLIDQELISAYLGSWASRGVFATNNASSYYVNTDPQGKGLNNPTVQEAETYRALIAMATAKSRRLVELLVTRDTRAVESFVLGQMGS